MEIPLPPHGGDATLLVREALEQCRAQHLKQLKLAPGTWHFYPGLAQEEYLFISNNDEGLKRIAFRIHDFHDFEIDGQGSLLIFHGKILPFVFQHSSGIVLKNIRVDWQRTFHSEARALDAHKEWADLEIPPQFPYRIEEGRLVFTGEGTDTFNIDNILEFDAKKRETAFKVYDNYRIGQRHRAEVLGENKVRFHATFTDPIPQPGNILALIDVGRPCPAVTISHCQNIAMENVTVHHAGAMGFIAQLSRNITLSQCRVIPSEGRMVSTRADATHFVCCSGSICLEDCEFSHQLDDAGNFHNVYTPLFRRISDHVAIVRLQHFQQWGLQPYAEGHEIELIQATNLFRGYPNRLTRVTPLNRELIQLEFASPLPPGIETGWAIGTRHWVADVTVRHTRVHSNRARGYLVTTSGKALFEENEFHSPGAAILVEGDARSWYEAGAVEDLRIRRNRFNDCNYGTWGRATLEINPAINPAERAGNYFHRNIAITENEFQTFHPNVLRAHCTDGLIFQNNTIHWDNHYPKANTGGQLFQYEHCASVEIVGNTVIPPQV